MKTQPTSIFNDVIGPVMTGPSSSHTAGPSRLGMMTRQLLSSDPVEIHIEFEKSGSFAASYNTQGTDRGLIGGLLGYKPENLKMLTALENASEKGILVTFSVSEFDAPHPNTARIRTIGKNGEQVSTVGISTGGGAIEMLEINGFDVSMAGDFFEVLLLMSRNQWEIDKARATDYLEASRQGRLIDTGAMDRIIAWTMAMVEVNSRYGIVVAAPTAGACGTVPGAVLGTAKYLGATREEKALAMLAAGAVGIAIANQATFAAEICGCQAECGAASAMAAAGIIHLMGGTVEQSNGAASISLQNGAGWRGSGYSS